MLAPATVASSSRLLSRTNRPCRAPSTHLTPARPVATDRTAEVAPVSPGSGLSVAAWRLSRSCTELPPPPSHRAPSRVCARSSPPHRIDRYLLSIKILCTGTPHIDLHLADVFERPDLIRDADVCFCYRHETTHARAPRKTAPLELNHGRNSTAFGSTGPYLTRLSYSFGTGLRVGSRCAQHGPPWPGGLFARQLGCNAALKDSLANAIRSPCVRA